MLVGIVEESRDLIFLSRVERPRDDRSAGGLDLPDQRLELGAVAPPGANGQSLGGEFLPARGADILPVAELRDRCVAFLHSRLSSSPHPEERRLRRVSKDEERKLFSWFE